MLLLKMLLGEMCKASKATQLPFPLNVNKTDPVENFFTMEREKPKKKKKKEKERMQNFVTTHFLSEEE